MKKCCICNLEKKLEDFNKFIRSKDGHRSDCRDCQSLKRKQYDEKYKKENPDKIKSSSNKYKMKNKEKLNKKSIEYYYKYKERDATKKSKYSKKFREENRDRLNQLSKDWREENKDKLKMIKKKYRENNRDKINEYQRSYMNKRLEIDPLFKLSHYIRKSIRESLKERGFRKTSKTQNIIGCTFNELKLYIESKFESWMSWDNYGLYNGESKYGWDIDHIIPLSSAKNEEDVIELNHYTNLQPLCSYINRVIKRDSVMT